MKAMDFYKRLEEQHPERRHLLGDSPEPPEKLAPCRECGKVPRISFVYALYGLPCYTVRCTCGREILPEPWACGVVYGNPHTITELAALRRACSSWNAAQIRKGA